MPYNRNNYSFVIDSSFQPFSMQEMLQPLAAYKSAYEQAEQQYEDIASQDIFKYLNNLPEGSKSKAIYDNYMTELNKQSDDLSKNGLNMGNRRALLNLRKRYKSEIGRLEAANTALQEEKKLRRQMNAKDSSMLYATDNMSLDEFLDGSTPNLYNISGTELYTRGAAAGKSASSRVYSAGDEGSTLGGYYRKWVERNGYSKESMDAFRANAAAIPELQQAADAILAERGVMDNLTGANLERARQSVLNGIIDGAVYQESVKPVRDAGVMSASERDSSARGWASHNLQKQKFNMEKQEWEDQRRLRYTFDDKGNVTGLNPEYVSSGYEVDPNTGKLKKKAKSTTAQTPEQKAENSKQKELLKLGKSDLGHNEGFDVTFGSDRHHYNYIGAISKHGDKWHHGAIGDDNPGHNFLRGWGFGSTSNVENIWGNFSAEGSDSNSMRVLSPDEMLRLVSTDTDLLQAIQERAQAMGVDPNTADIQLIEVPNEKGGGGEKGYLIAVH